MISVVVCAYNPNAARLSRVLEGLRNQTLPPDEWELLVIDNASTVPLAGQLQILWHPRATIRREEILGLTHARLHGIREASGDLIVFVDDDNILAPDFLAEALVIARDWPILGAWGGRIDPEFETTPPDWTREFWHLLAINLVEAPCWSNGTGQNHAVPPGAGLCVRREVARAYAQRAEVDPIRRQLDRVGSSLSSCGDIDLAMTACETGLGVGLFPALKLTHIMPAARLEIEYLLRLVEGVAYSAHVFDYVRGRRPADLEISRLRGWFDAYMRWRMPPRQRAFAEARERARQRAIAELSVLDRALRNQRLR